MNTTKQGAYGADDDLVDYILGITFEIWEEGGAELIHQYYGADIVVYGLDGITRGAAAMVDGTRAMLEAFPDRLLLADDVIWSGSREEGYYSSHRIISPMTNKGATIFGPATDRHVRILTIADCVVEDGVITREWLLRDNHALVSQLGHDPIECARIVAGTKAMPARTSVSSTRTTMIVRSATSTKMVPFCPLNMVSFLRGSAGAQGDSQDETGRLEGYEGRVRADGIDRLKEGSHG